MIDAGEFLKWLYVFNVSFGGGVITIPVPMSQGGTGANLTPVNGEMVYSTGSAMALLPTSAFGVLKTDGSGIPQISNVLPQNITLANDPTSAMMPVTLQYLQNAIQDVNPACFCATYGTDSLSTWTYNNGASGVGATLTAPSNGASVFDGQTPADGQRIFVIDQASNLPWQGIYTIAQGTGGTPTVLTRATNYDQPSEIVPGGTLVVIEGTNYGGTTWMMSQTNPITIGTTPITFNNITNSGLGTMAYQYANNVNISGGSAILGTLRYDYVYTDLSGDFVLLHSNSNEAFNFINPALDLSDALGVATYTLGFQFVVKNTSGGDCTFTPKAGDTIDGASSLTIKDQESYIIMASTGQWSVIAMRIGLPIAMAYGGAGAALTPSDGGLVYSTASALAILAGTATAHQVPLSGSNSAPGWSTATYLDTIAANSIMYGSSLNVIGELTSVNNAVLGTTNAGVPTWRALTDGQILIGSSVGAPLAATITGGNGVNVTNGHNSITIDINPASQFIDQNVSPVTLVANKEYLVDNGGSQLVFNMPVTANPGDVFAVYGYSSGGWIVNLQSGQSIIAGNVTGTATITSNLPSDFVIYKCIVANTVFKIIGSGGQPDYA